MIKELHTNVLDIDDCRRTFERINQILVGTGTVNEIQKEDVRVGDPDIRILDFDKHFILTESPDRDMDIALRLGSIVDTGVVSVATADFNVAAGEVTLKNSARGLFAATASDTVANTTTQTNFSPAGEGSVELAANSLAVGQVYRIKASGILSTV